MGDYLVSAIVSVYNCERFIAGCLEDLEQQTIADKVEIVVVNSGSQQNEEAIIKKFQEKYNNIVYIKTENRETIYQTWNRGIKAASGKYITNANSDDRHRKDAFEVMMKVLESDDNIALVYADSIITKMENETFENHTSAGSFTWPEFDRYELLHDCFIGPQPMWRKSIHDEFGYFAEELKVAGDYEFWLRIAEKYDFKHIREYLGLYLMNPNSVEHGNPEATVFETEMVRRKYMMRIAHDKKKFTLFRKMQSDYLFDNGYNFFEKKRFLLARKAFFHGINWNPYNFKNYKCLLICYLPIQIIAYLKKQ